MLHRISSPQCVRPVLNLAFAGILASGIAASTTFGQSFGRGGPQTAIGSSSVTATLTSESARIEVGITKAQQEQIDKLNEERRNSLRDAGVDFRSMSDDERRKFFEKQQQDTEAKLKTILTAEQYARLQQIGLHRTGLSVVTRDEKLATELKVTEEQKKAIGQILEDYSDRVRDSNRSGSSSQNRDKLRADRDAKYLAVLTPTQQQQWLEKIGPAPEAMPARTPEPTSQIRDPEERRLAEAVLKSARAVVKALEANQSGSTEFQELLRQETVANLAYLEYLKRGQAK
jgi:hypothetical protein